MDLTTVYRTFNLVDADLIMGRLEAAGIPATMVNENSALAVTGANVPGVELRITVEQGHVDDAKSLIADMERAT
jgi:hypothetical protein